MRQEARGKHIAKIGILAVLAIGFTMLLPQMVMSIEGIIFGAVWLMIAVMGAISVWHQRRTVRRRVLRREVYSFKKKLRTPEKEARSRITVRLKA